MEISIIIVSYKMKRLVKNCIRAIRESSISVPYEIIVVDNDSRDGIEELMKENFPEIKLIMSPKNLGMGGGNNLGIKAAQGKYVLILNPDIFVFHDSIQKMYDYIKNDPKAGVVSPRLLNPDKTLQSTCYRWHGALTPLYRRTFLGKTSFGKKDLDRFLMKDFDHLTVKEVDWCQGSCWLAPKKVFDQVGLFDEGYFMYFEDTDLCRRVWNAGFKVVYLGNVEMIHMHTRQSQGGLLKIFTNKLTRAHIRSWVKYVRKFGKG
jgi:GT2 family glycosyltransferase